MKTEQRLLILKILAAAGAGLWLLDIAVIEPLAASWSAQSERIEALSVKVKRGQGLLQREDAIRTHWADMVRANLPEEVAAAESLAFKAVGRWETDSRIPFTSLTQQWQAHDEGYKTYELRVSAEGNQATIGRLLFEIETDPAPVSLEEVELTTRDNRGSQLMLTARFSFLSLVENGRKSR